MIKQPNGKLRVTTRGDRIEVFSANKLVAYVEDDILRAIDKDGYASEVGPINHRAEIIGKLSTWREKNSGASMPRQP